MTKRPAMPPVVRCARCGVVIIEAKPTKRRGVVCAKCMGVKMHEGVPLGILLALAFVVYGTAATWTFRLRHPWATETQLTLHFVDVLTFGRVPKP